VVNNEHLTEALRRLRKTSSDNNVDRYVKHISEASTANVRVSRSRLVTNILLSFLNTHRGDSKRFEMLSLLSTILSWNDVEREKAGLQRVLTVKSGTPAEKGKRKDVRGERSAEEEAAMNEVGFLLCSSFSPPRSLPSLPSLPPMALPCPFPLVRVPLPVLSASLTLISL